MNQKPGHRWGSDLHAKRKLERLADGRLAKACLLRYRHALALSTATQHTVLLGKVLEKAHLYRSGAWRRGERRIGHCAASSYSTLRRVAGCDLHQPNDPEPREGEHDLWVFVCVCVCRTPAYTNADIARSHAFIWMRKQATRRRPCHRRTTSSARADDEYETKSRRIHDGSVVGWRVHLHQVGKAGKKQALFGVF